jgi:glyoxylase-like metal-dependent hydrolase (beta-lactamase superfamily II)
VKISWRTVGPFQENSYLVVDEASGRCALVDPGDEAARIIAAVEESGATLDAVWLTHAHIDHIGALAAVKRRWDVPVWMHAADEPLFAAAPMQAQFYGLRFDVPPRPERTLADGDVLTLGALRFTVMHVPGHAPGLCVFHGHGVAIAGDLLFAGSIGRTDLPLSSPQEMQRSLDRIAQLPSETVVYPGHGAVTTIGEERESNPFLNGLARVAGARG